MSNFERKYPPGYHHVICIGETLKLTSKKGLLSEALGMFFSFFVAYAVSRHIRNEKKKNE